MSGEIRIRAMFKPDPGYILIDADLKGADAQVVAWDAGAEDLKAAFRAGLDIHPENAAFVWGDKWGKPERQKAKGLVHATNYGGKARTLASNFELTIAAVERFQEYWFDKHPAIRDWHNRIAYELQSRSFVQNAWGFKRPYFDRADAVFTQALAWLGQSTVAITINKAMARLHRKLPEVQLLLQVHDSLLMQVPEDRLEIYLPQIQELMCVEVPYADPLIIPVTIKASAISWADCEETYA